jgi:hypothetical protein
MPASYRLIGSVSDSKTFWRSLLRQILFSSLLCHEKVTSFYLQHRRTYVVHTSVLSSNIYWVDSWVGSTFQRRTSLLPVVSWGNGKQMAGISLVLATLPGIRNPRRERGIREKLTTVTHSVYGTVLIYNICCMFIPENTGFGSVFLWRYDATRVMASSFTRFLDHTSDAPQSVGLLWTSDQFVADTSTWQHTTITTDKYPCHRWDSNLWSQQASGRRPKP